MCGGGGGKPQQQLYVPPEPEPEPKQKKKIRRGRESRPTLLTGSQGVTDETTIGTQTLIGS